MQRPLFERTELIQIGRTLGSMLVLFGGLALVVEGFLSTRLPDANGYLPLTATVIDLEQIGSFQNPAFLVTLAYDVLPTDDTSQEVRSGQRVEFEQYFELTIGHSVDIHYNPNNPSDWRMDSSNDELSEYGLGLLMIIFGVFSLSFPTIIGWASRQDDFEFKDELDDVEVSGVNTN